MTPAPQDRQLGEYRLTELLNQSPLTLTWLAEQVSVGRRVVVDELRPEQDTHRPEFLADVRAKAAVEHPLVGSVYEASSTAHGCFFAHELLSAPTLANRLYPAAPLTPLRLAQVLRRVAEAQIHHESLGQASSPLSPQHIHLDEHGVVRLDNLVIAGERSPECSTRDLIHLGTTLPPLVADGQPGANRVLTLLAWMRGDGTEKKLSWDQVRELCNQIEQQLTGTTPDALGKSSSTPSRKASSWLPWTIAAIVMICLAAGSTAFFLSRPPRKLAPPPRATLPPAVTIPAGNYPTLDGTTVTLPAFRISAHEITIGQYAEFLDTLATLEKSGQHKIYDAKNGPPTKKDHFPDNWSALLAAAKQRSNWLSLPVSLDSPITGIDWWDAAAYAEWKKGRLPTQEEWSAALHKNSADPTTLKPAPWLQDVTQTSDRTLSGLLAMAGSICEWTANAATDPANPLGAQKWPILGGSYLKPGSNALTREWSTTRSLRRNDLGFRIVLDPP